MRFRLLGPVELLDDAGEVIPLRGDRVRTLLALLLLNCNEVVTMSRMLDCIWGEHPPASARKNVQTYIWRIRQLFESDRLQRYGAGYVLEVGPGELDVEVFQELTAEGERQLASGDPAKASATLTAAISLWRGTPFNDVIAADPPVAEITRLCEMYDTNLENRIEADLRCGSSAEAIAELRSLIAEYPFRERLRSLLMLALNQCGRRVEALTVFTDFRVAMQSQFGMEPGPEMHEIQSHVLCGEAPGIGTPAQESGIRPAGAGLLDAAEDIASARRSDPQRRLA